MRVSASVPKNTNRHRLITHQFCVMTPNGPHPAYGAKDTLEEAQAAIKFDGGQNLSVAWRRCIVTATAWEPVETEEGEKQ